MYKQINLQTNGTLFFVYMGNSENCLQRMQAVKIVDLSLVKRLISQKEIGEI